ncbi:hypothetical protein GCM10009562_26760 [Nocardioides aquaticus]
MSSGRPSKRRGRYARAGGAAAGIGGSGAGGIGRADRTGGSARGDRRGGTARGDADEEGVGTHGGVLEGDRARRAYDGVPGARAAPPHDAQRTRAPRMDGTDSPSPDRPPEPGGSPGDARDDVRAGR